MNINKFILRDSKIAFYKSNKNLKSRFEIMILRISQSIKIKNKTFIHFANF